MKKLIIVGAGGFGRELLQWCKEINDKYHQWKICGFLDDNPHALAGIECDVPILGTISNWNPQKDEEYVIAIAKPAIKEKVVKLLENRGANFVSIIHPDANIGNFCKIGKGVIIYPDARITVNVKIDDFVTVLNNTSIGHDAKIGKYSTIFGGCGVNGYVSVGDKVLVGCNTSINPGIKIGNDAVVGIGSVVITNVKDGQRVFGNPAKKLAVPDSKVHQKNTI